MIIITATIYYLCRLAYVLLATLLALIVTAMSAPVHWWRTACELAELAGFDPANSRVGRRRPIDLLMLVQSGVVLFLYSLGGFALGMATCYLVIMLGLGGF